MNRNKKHTATVSLVKASSAIRKQTEIDIAFEELKEFVDGWATTSSSPDCPDFITLICNLVENLDVKTLKRLKGADKKELAMKLIRYKFPDALGDALHRVDSLIDFVVSSKLVARVAVSTSLKSALLRAVGSFFGV